MQFRQVLGVVAAAILLWALAVGSARAEPEGEEAQPQSLLVEAGAKDFRRYCTSCHGWGGRGDGPVAAALNTKPADLTRIAVRRGGTFPAAEIAAYIDGRTYVAAHGAREMPVWGRRFSARISEDTTDEEVVRGRLLVLVEYLRTLQESAESKP